MHCPPPPPQSPVPHPGRAFVFGHPRWLCAFGEPTRFHDFAVAWWPDVLAQDMGEQVVKERAVARKVMESAVSQTLGGEWRKRYARHYLEAYGPDPWISIQGSTGIPHLYTLKMDRQLLDRIGIRTYQELQKNPDARAYLRPGPEAGSVIGARPIYTHQDSGGGVTIIEPHICWAHDPPPASGEESIPVAYTPGILRDPLIEH